MKISDRLFSYHVTGDLPEKYNFSVVFRLVHGNVALHRMLDTISYGIAIFYYTDGYIGVFHRSQANDTFYFLYDLLFEPRLPLKQTHTHCKVSHLPGYWHGRE